VRAESSDVYSLAVLLWDLLALGRAGSPDVGHDVTRLGPEWLDGAVAELVMRSLSTDAGSRPRDPGAFAAELVRALSDRVLPVGAATQASADMEYDCTVDETEDALTVARPPRRVSAGPFSVLSPNVRLVAEPPANRAGSTRAKARAPAAAKALLRVIGGAAEAEGALRLGGGAGKWVIGRATSGDLVLADPDMSRTHFEIVRDGDGFRVHDLGSKNGLFVNGRVTKDLRLRPGDELLAGATRLRFET
jgi:hypothetical protein